MRSITRLVFALPLCAGFALHADRAVAIEVLNHSFEAPGTVFVDTLITHWVKTGPDGTDDGTGISGQIDTGVFFNSAIDLDGPGGDDPIAGPIPNADGNQLAFFQVNPTAAPEVTLSQVTAATYTAGEAYKLTVAVGMSYFFAPTSTDPVNNPALLELALGFFDSSDEFQLVQTALASPSDFVPPAPGSQFALIDFDVLTDVLGTGDAALGESIAIRFRAAGGTGGVWNLDNVRLAVVPEPGVAVVMCVAGVPLALARRRRLR